ncbi:hypothetical protein LSH36_217g05002 [Paralvinella palmiformis]|uniref:Uncharacterized protein n=1 Tax=Paralvinella palmiformis TaxID=53620 RepID=A0AAD9N5K8_9ANNE|nr:hypothetical protein LSH36_217g05002 [Paralvinella palmiformis]
MPLERSSTTANEATELTTVQRVTMSGETTTGSWEGADGGCLGFCTIEDRDSTSVFYFNASENDVTTSPKAPDVVSGSAAGISPPDVAQDYLDFVTWWNPTHGNCFTFNSGSNTSDELHISYKPGHRHGLVVILNINQDEYFSGDMGLAAARVIIDSQQTMAFPEDDGITVIPGRANLLALQKLKMIHKEWPYGDCIRSDTKDVTLNMYQESYPVLYSDKACQKTCYQRQVVAECGCRDGRIAAIKQWSQIPICHIDNKTQGKR